jgi:hypothetical protein
MNYLDTALSSSDSTAIVTLANLCPNTDGAIVYNARALYAAAYNDHSVWDEDLPCNTYTGERGSIHQSKTPAPGLNTLTNSKQQVYSLYPNPASGMIYIQQSADDKEPVQAEIWNSEGKSVYKQTLLFRQKTASINTGCLLPGLYLLQLTDHGGNSYTLKFILN